MTDKDFREMVKEALENWDFEAADNGPGLKSALEYMEGHPQGMASVFENNYQDSHSDKWQALDEMANVYASMK
jgi:hypothetical protein